MLQILISNIYIINIAFNGPMHLENAHKMPADIEVQTMGRPNVNFSNIDNYQSRWQVMPLSVS